jgi:hypothetical protein
MQVNFYDLGLEDAMGSLELFSQEVIGHVTG